MDDNNLFHFVEEENDDGNLGLGVLQMAPPIPQVSCSKLRKLPGVNYFLQS